MKTKKYTIISVFILAIIFIFQTNSLLKNSFANRLLNPKYTINWNNYYNMLYGYSLEASKNYIDNNKNVFVLLGNNLTNYTNSLDIERGFTNVLMYPNGVVEVLHLSDIDDSFVEYLISKKTNYIIFMGKNETYHNQMTYNDINIYKMDVLGNLNLIKSFDNDLYSLSIVFKENHQEDKFYDLLTSINKLSETYWFPETINALKVYADKFYENKEYNEAIKYYQEVLKYGLNKEIFYNLGDIYFIQKDYDKSLENFMYCKSIDANYLDVNEKIKEVGETK